MDVTGDSGKLTELTRDLSFHYLMEQMFAVKHDSLSLQYAVTDNR